MQRAVSGVETAPARVAPTCAILRLECWSGCMDICTSYIRHHGSTTGAAAEKIGSLVPRNLTRVVSSVRIPRRGVFARQESLTSIQPFVNLYNPLQANCSRNSWSFQQLSPRCAERTDHLGLRTQATSSLHSCILGLLFVIAALLLRSRPYLGSRWGWL